MPQSENASVPMPGRATIVRLGDAIKLTGAVGTPVRDNPDSAGPPAYHNAHPEAEGSVQFDD